MSSSINYYLVQVSPLVTYRNQVAYLNIRQGSYSYSRTSHKQYHRLAPKVAGCKHPSNLLCGIWPVITNRFIIWKVTLNLVSVYFDIVHVQEVQNRRTMTINRTALLAMLSHIYYIFDNHLLYDSGA